MTMTRFIPGWKPMIIRRLREGRTLQQAAGLTGVGMGKLADERKRDEAFDKQIEEVLSTPRKTLQW